MTLNILATAAALSDDALLARVQILAGRERQAASELIAHLAELDTRQVLIAEGYSLFTYCTTRLGLSEDAAYTRVEVARAARRFPMILERLADGSLTLTTIRLVGRHLTADNHENVLEKARHQSKREIELLVAQLAPRPDVPSSIRRLPLRALVPQAEGPNGEPPRGNDVAALTSPDATAGRVPAPASPPLSRPVVSPLSPERYRVQLTVGQETHDKLRRLQDLLRKEIPSGDPAVIVDRALTLLLQVVAKRKLAQPQSRGGPVPERVRPAGRRPRPRGMSRRRFGERSGNGTTSGAHTSRRAATAVPSGRSSRSTTSIRMRWAAHPPWLTWLCAVTATMSMKRSWSSGPGPL